MKALLESGVHFGHRTNKWHPAMKPYIFTERNGIHIIDLQQTAKALNNAYALVRDTVAEGKTILFVGTKRQAQETIHDEAVRCGMPYVTERWLGGTLTNWTTIYKRIQEMERLEKLHADEEQMKKRTKKEGLMIERDIARLQLHLNGIRDMGDLPALIFVIDVQREATAIHEANLKGIPVIAMVDTNCDPQNVDYVIPSNDDAIRAIKLVVGKIADAVIEGRSIYDKENPDAVKAAAAVETTKVATEPAAGEESDDDLLSDATRAKIEKQEADAKDNQ